MLSGKITIALAGLGSRGKDTYAQAVKKFPEKMEIVASILVFGILGYDLYGMMKNNIRK